MLHSTVERLFAGSGTVVEGFLQRLPAALSAVLSYLTTSALTVGTGCLAAYMISARLPRLRKALADAPWTHRLLRLRHALWGWLKAQLKLSGLCFLILTVGLTVLDIPYAPLWSFFIALVDAVPLLGTGTVLIPWAVVSLLQHRQLQAVGLLIIYGITFFARNALEPRLVGKQLGLDPLLTLAALYAGFLFWGIGGMLLAPLACVVVKEVLAEA
jgi:predicted PurR-regulated permease PerM